MRKLLVLGSLVGVSLPLLAAAQPPPPPPPPPGGGGGGYAGDPAVAAEPKMRIDVGLVVGLPQGDLEDSNVDTSPGLNLQFGYTVIPNLSLAIGVRYFAIQTKEEVAGELGNYDFLIGGRYAFPVGPTAKIFGEGLLQYTTLSFEPDGGGSSESESGIGFQIRGGGMFRVSGNISIGAALSFSSASVEIQGFDLDVGWMGLEGFASFGF